MRLVYCVNAARFLNVAAQVRGDIAHFSDFFGFRDGVDLVGKL